MSGGSRLEAVSDVLVLAAVDRAARHRRIGKAYASMRSIAGHLGLVHHGWTSRGLRPHLNALREAGAITPVGRSAWAVTAKGHRRLAQARRAGVVVLPESPQHQAWRDGRTQAGERIDRFRAELRDALSDAHALLDAESSGNDPEFDPERVEAATWLSLGRRLAWESERLGTALFCLNEWAEPDDARADTPRLPGAGILGRERWDDLLRRASDAAVEQEQARHTNVEGGA